MVVKPILCGPLPDRVAPVFVQVVFPPLGSSLKRLMFPTQDNLIFLTFADCVYDFCLVSDLDVGPSVHVYDVEHTSFHLCNMHILSCLKLQFQTARLEDVSSIVCFCFMFRRNSNTSSNVYCLLCWHREIIYILYCL